MNKLKSFLYLIRFPNVFTAASNILAAYVISTSGKIDLPDLLLLVFSSVLLYSSGMVFNDYHDRKQDALSSPNRPIPSGNVSVSEALILGSSLALLGLVLTALVSFKALIIGLILLIAILNYDFLLKKHHLIAALGMGLCRAFNWLLGMSTGEIKMSYSLFWLVYIALLTFMARFESKNKKIKKYVIMGLSFIPVIDALILVGNGFYIWGIVVISLLIPITILKRKFYMT